MLDSCSVRLHPFLCVPCALCGEFNCRTVEVGGSVFEAVPEELIVKAALVAASQLIGPNMEDLPGQGEKPCCDDKSETDEG